MLPDLSALPPELQQQIAQIEQQANAQLEELQATVTVEAIGALFKDQRIRPFVLEVETDSTIEPDQIAERQAREQFAAAVSPVIQQGVMAMQMAPDLGPFMAESLRFIANGYKIDRKMDEAIDALAEKWANYQPQPEPGGEDPALAQMKVQVEQVKAEAAQAKGQADIQIAQLKLQGEQMKARMGQLEAEKTGAETEKLRAEVMKIMSEIETDRAQLQLDAQAQQIDAQGQVEDRALEREGMATDAEMQERQFSAEQERAQVEDKREDKRMAFEAKQADRQHTLDKQAAMKPKPTNG